MSRLILILIVEMVEVSGRGSSKQSDQRTYVHPAPGSRSKRIVASGRAAHSEDQTTSDGKSDSKIWGCWAVFSNHGLAGSGSNLAS